MRYTLVLVASVVASSVSYASDHIDGPVTKKHGVADITDLYAFPSNNGQALSIVLNAYPILPSGGHFSSKVGYAVIIRKASIRQDASAPGFATSDEIRIDCRLTSDHGDKRAIDCASNTGLSARTTQNKLTSSGDFKVFFGPRSDPFFFDDDWAVPVSTEGDIPKPGGSNTMSSLNVLSIVLEIERSKMFGGAFQLLAVAAESYEQLKANTSRRRLDRVGRPEITNVSLVPDEFEEIDVRDKFNLEQPFNVRVNDAQLYTERLQKKIKYYDGLDKKEDWTEPDRTRLAKVLVDDHLVIDIAKPCKKDNFLEIERSLLASKPHTTCGGRELTDDIMDRLFNIYINNEKGLRVSDGVDKPHKEVSGEFPYLAPPDRGLWTWFKAVLGRWKAGADNNFD